MASASCTVRFVDGPRGELGAAASCFGVTKSGETGTVPAECAEGFPVGANCPAATPDAAEGTADVRCDVVTGAVACPVGRAGEGPVLGAFKEEASGTGAAGARTDGVVGP